MDFDMMGRGLSGEVAQDAAVFKAPKVHIRFVELQARVEKARFGQGLAKDRSS